jgi:hypothetical protein
VFSPSFENRVQCNSHDWNTPCSTILTLFGKQSTVYVLSQGCMSDFDTEQVSIFQLACSCTQSSLSSNSLVHFFGLTASFLTNFDAHFAGCKEILASPGLMLPATYKAKSIALSRCTFPCICCEPSHMNHYNTEAAATFRTHGPDCTESR